MNKWRNFPISILLLLTGLGIPEYSKACNIVSSIQCLNSTYFLWCVDDGDGTLTTIGDAVACPGTLVCDDTQDIGCVLAETVQTTTELDVDSTTNAETTTELDVDSTTNAETTTELDVESTTNSETATTETEESDTVSDADFVCTWEGLYQAQDCSRFHVCYKIIWFIQHYFARCSQGLYWSSNEKRCVLKSLSDCP